jgi:ABC-type phosphonate transport system ATPase subunit
MESSSNTVTEVNPVNEVPPSPPRPAGGVIKDLALRLIDLASGVEDLDLGRAMIVVCHDLIVAGRDMEDRAQTLAARCYAQQAEIMELNRKER